MMEKLRERFIASSGVDCLYVTILLGCILLDLVGIWFCLLIIERFDGFNLKVALITSGAILIQGVCIIIFISELAKLRKEWYLDD